MTLAYDPKHIGFGIKFVNELKTDTWREGFEGRGDLYALHDYDGCEDEADSDTRFFLDKVCQ